MNLTTIINAKSPEEVFGLVNDVKTLHKEFRRLSKIAHPDKNGGSRESETAFNLLVVWYERAEYKIKKGTYGNVDALPNTVNIISKRGEYYVVELIKEGNLANVYSALDKNTQPVVVKVTRNPANNDLARGELKSLKTIAEVNAGLPALANIPKIFDSFQINQDGKQKHVNVFEEYENIAGWYSLEQVMNGYPEGLDLRDAAWMLNRLLSALLMAHQAGIVHGAIVPSHIMLHLPTHRGVLIDWSYAVNVGSKAKAVFPEMNDYMPPEILKREPLTFGTDLYMAAKLLLRLVGGEESLPAFPPRVRGLFRACLLTQGKRLNDVNEFYITFSNILDVLYGPRQFRPFTMKDKGVRYGWN